MEQLQAQLADLEAQKAKLFEDGTADQVLVSRLNEQIKAVQFQIAQLNAQQAVIEEKVNGEGIPLAITGVDFTNMPSGLIEVIDKIVRADRRRIYADQAKIEVQRDAENAAYKEQTEQRIAVLQQDYASLELEYVDATADLKEQTAETLRAIAERDEARKNRDNAAVQLSEAQKEIARLNSQIDDYQKAKVFGEREAQNVIEIEAEASEVEAINTALKNLYTSFENYGNINKVTKPDGSTELVKSDALLNEWTQAPAGGSETSQGTFPEVPALVTEVGGLSDTEAAITPPPFQGDMAAGDGAVSSVVEDEPVTRGEFEALKRDVELLKQGQVGVAA